MAIKNKSKIIYKKDNITIKEVNFEEYSFMDYISYEDEQICFSKDKMSIMFNFNIKEDDVDDIIQSVLKLSKMFKEIYSKSVKEKNIFSATSFCEKRDLTSFFYKMLSNMDFDYKALYEFAATSYSRIECDYGYDNLIYGMEICISKDESIIKDLKKALKKYTKDGTLKVYRGTNEKNRDNGYSYTLDYKVAKFFANRWGKKGKVNEYEININDVIAFIDSGESEIIAKKSVFKKEVIK